MRSRVVGPHEAESLDRRSLPVRIAVFATICLFAVALAAGALLLASREHHASGTGGSVPVADHRLATVPSGEEPSLLFENTSAADRYGQLAAVPVDNPSAPRQIADLEC